MTGIIFAVIVGAIVWVFGVMFALTYWQALILAGVMAVAVLAKEGKT